MFKKLLLASTFLITSTSNVLAGGGGGGGGSGPLGTINAPAGVPTIARTGNDPSAFVGKIIQNGLTLLITSAFIIALVWTIIAGIRFITAGSDEKTVASAWSQIYWGLIGLVVVLGSFAIIKIVETAFGVNIIQNFQIPTL